MDKIDIPAFQLAFERAADRQGFHPQVLTRLGEEAITLWRRPCRGLADRCIFISAGMHGDEPAGPLGLLEFLEAHRLSETVDWILLPLFNLSGLQQATRENAEGLDLNRDFLTCHSQEVKAFIQWWKAEQPQVDLHISLHEDWEADGFYMYEINTGEIPSDAARILTGVATGVPLQQGEMVDGHQLSAMGLIYHEAIPDLPDGWPEAIWVVKQQPMISYTFEAPGQRDLAQRVLSIRLALETALAAYF